MMYARKLQIDALAGEIEEIAAHRAQREIGAEHDDDAGREHPQCLRRAVGDHAVVDVHREQRQSEREQAHHGGGEQHIAVERAMLQHGAPEPVALRAAAEFGRARRRSRRPRARGSRCRDSAPRAACAVMRVSVPPASTTRRCPSSRRAARRPGLRAAAVSRVRPRRRAPPGCIRQCASRARRARRRVRPAKAPCGSRAGADRRSGSRARPACRGSAPRRRGLRATDPVRAARKREVAGHLRRCPCGVGAPNRRRSTAQYSRPYSPARRCRKAWSFCVSSANLRMPSASFSVAIASSFSLPAERHARRVRVSSGAAAPLPCGSSSARKRCARMRRDSAISAGAMVSRSQPASARIWSQIAKARAHDLGAHSRNALVIRVDARDGAHARVFGCRVGVAPLVLACTSRGCVPTNGDMSLTPASAHAAAWAKPNSRVRLQRMPRRSSSGCGLDALPGRGDLDQNAFARRCRACS
jgi:hypothetical protein